MEKIMEKIGKKNRKKGNVLEEEKKTKKERNEVGRHTQDPPFLIFFPTKKFLFTNKTNLFTAFLKEGK
jgi:hypothetical protein